jgi:hypothetical protein
MVTTLAETWSRTPALSRSMAKTPTASLKLTEVTQHVWLNGMLNEWYNQLPDQAVTDQQANQPTDATPNGLARWALRKKQQNSRLTSQ